MKLKTSDFTNQEEFLALNFDSFGLRLLKLEFKAPPVPEGYCPYLFFGDSSYTEEEKKALLKYITPMFTLGIYEWQTNLEDWEANFKKFESIK